MDSIKRFIDTDLELVSESDLASESNFINEKMKTYALSPEEVVAIYRIRVYRVDSIIGIPVGAGYLLEDDGDRVAIWHGAESLESQKTLADAKAYILAYSRGKVE